MYNLHKKIGELTFKKIEISRREANESEIQGAAKLNYTDYKQNTTAD